MWKYRKVPGTQAYHGNQMVSMEWMSCLLSCNQSSSCISLSVSILPIFSYTFISFAILPTPLWFFITLLFITTTFFPFQWFHDETFHLYSIESVSRKTFLKKCDFFVPPSLSMSLSSPGLELSCSSSRISGPGGCFWVQKSQAGCQRSNMTVVGKTSCITEPCAEKSTTQSNITTQKFSCSCFKSEWNK